MRRDTRIGITFLFDLALQLVDLLFFGRVGALFGLIVGSVETEDRSVRVYLRIADRRLDFIAFVGFLFHFN